MTRARGRNGFSLLEVTLSLAAIALLLAILIPALSAARLAAFKDQCAANQRVIGQAWLEYLDQHGEFPTIYADPAWTWGGVRFSATTSQPYLDLDRPLNRFLPVSLADGSAANLFHCPADTGISDPQARTGTGPRTAFASFGTSYRANTRLLDARVSGLEDVQRPLKLAEVTTPHPDMIIMGTPVWFEVLARTGRSADWFGTRGAGNMLCLDGSVKFLVIDTDSRRVTAMFNPIAARNEPEPRFPATSDK